MGRSARPDEHDHFPEAPLTVEAVRARLEAAMGLGQLPDWLDEAERQILAHQAMKRRRRLFDVSSVAARLRTAREVRGYTQRQLAARLGMKHHWSIQGFETGVRDVPARLFPKLCVALGVTPAWVLAGGDAGGPAYDRREAPRKLVRVGWAHQTRLEKARRRAALELERVRALKMSAGPASPSPAARAASADAPPLQPMQPRQPPSDALPADGPAFGQPGRPGERAGAG